MLPVVLAACAATPPRVLHPTSGDRFSLVNPGPAPAPEAGARL